MADLERVESMQFPSGHLAHLSDSQQAQLDEFKKICQNAGYWTPGTPGTPPSHDDETMLRYLRARRFVPQEAFKQFKDTEDWRKASKLSEIFHTIETEEYEQTRQLYPQWLGRRDKRGIPLYVFEVAPLNSKNIATYEKNLAKSKTVVPNLATKNVRLFALYESLTRFITPLCSMAPRPYPETPISQSNNIVDINKVGLKQFWNLKSHMQDASLLATAHYPETLDRIFIVGAPSFFPTVWGWIKRWFDPITVSKIFILSPANIYSTLIQYIDHENIPKKYGGGLDFEFGQMPDLEPAIQQQIVWQSPNVQKGRNTLPIGPLKWEEGALGEMQAWAVGNENGVPRRQLVFTIPKPIGYTKGATTHPNTPAFQSRDPLTTVGTATHPSDTGADDAEIQTPPSDSDETPSSSKNPAPESLAPGAALSSELPIRQGTSDAKFEQQNCTHAAGQVAQGTPHAVTTEHDSGDKTVTVEPRTVGQAPKEIPLPEPEQPAAPSYLEQAQNAAASATSAITSTVSGLAGAVIGTGKEEPKVDKPVEELNSGKEKEMGQEIDKADDKNVAAFLREKSTPATT